MMKKLAASVASEMIRHISANVEREERMVRMVSDEE